MGRRPHGPFLSRNRDLWRIRVLAREDCKSPGKRASEVRGLATLSSSPPRTRHWASRNRTCSEHEGGW